MLEAIIKRLKRDKRGVSNVIVVMLSLPLIVVIVANVVLWSYQMNQFDWNKMQENLTLLNVTPFGQTWSYNPSAYTLGGSTSRLSGSVSDLTADDGVYMTFRSYTETDTIDFVDQTCDLYPPPAKGTHSNFTAQQYGPHGIHDTLTEENTVSNWLSGWDERARITIDHNDVDGALSNFPVLLYLSNSSGRHNDDVTFVFDEVGSNSKKIAVTTNDGTTECYVEIEKWDAASGQAWLWVKVPSISNTTETDLYLYYDADHADNTDYVGDPNSTPAENVWDSNYTGVWHLDDTIVDSVDIGGGSSGTPSGTPSATPTFAYFDELNTANANGFITQVKINVDTVGDGDLRIMTCSRAGNTFTVRDFENLAVTGTGVRTFSVNLEVATGDYLGFWASTVSVERETYASSQYLYQDTGTVPSVGQTYSATQGATLVRLMIEGNGDAISVLDSTNNNNDGSVIGSEETIGQIDNAQDFDGTDDYVNISADLAQWLGKTASLSVWIRTTQVGSSIYWDSPGVTGVEEAGGANDIFWGLIDASGKMGIQAGDTAGAITTSPINDDNWHHIVMTRNSSTGEVKIYVDGILNDIATSDTGDKTNSFYSIGRIEDTGGTPEYFSGTIDEFRISNTTRSLAWIGASYESERDDLLDFGSEETPNYELDLEIQWTNVDYDETNERLCIYAGDLDAENLSVDYWDGDSWESIDTDLDADSWNNYTISLASPTYTIRFKDGTNTSDTTPNSWDIDVTLLHVWTESSEYTVEVEFTGSSNTEDWSQLNWTVNCAWTVSSVNVTLQLYNYTLDSYPTSGNGYMAYTSDDTPNTDENRSQTINVNPIHFIDATGHWKIKIKGVKTAGTPFDFKVDWIEFKVAKVTGTLFTFRNEGPLTSHVVSLWINNATHHQRYDTNIFINSGDSESYIRSDVTLPNKPYTVKVVTERGNTAVFTGHQTE